VNVYFDTNIYRFITERNEIRQVAELLRQFECRLSVSTLNLLETFAVKSLTDRSREMETMIRLGNDYPPTPESYLHALEVRREVKRLRPRWLNRGPRRGMELSHLRNHRAVWAAAKAGRLPSAFEFEPYSVVAERGIASVREIQKYERKSVHDGFNILLMRTPDGSAVTHDFEDPEFYWRFQGLNVWFEAVEKQSPAMRDYADWLRPYLRPNSFTDPSYFTFWIDEVLADAMPLNRLTGLVSFYQLKQKPTHGNAIDQIHATCWLTNDLFITADRAFYEALTSAAGHYPGRRLPVLVNRELKSMASQLEEILKVRLARTSEIPKT
jgi:hypothetical protein